MKQHRHALQSGTLVATFERDRRDGEVAVSIEHQGDSAAGTTHPRATASNAYVTDVSAMEPASVLSDKSERRSYSPIRYVQSRWESEHGER